jgi:DNA-binding transcriptional ArsR family regulator
MVRKKVIFKERTSHYARFYVRHLDDKDKKVLVSLRQRRLREIVLIVLRKEKIKYSDLLDSLKIPPSTLSFYLKYLIEKKILSRDKIGYENIYFIKEKERISRVLLTYKASFLDKLVDKAMGTWMETEFLKSKTNN